MTTPTPDEPLELGEPDSLAGTFHDQIATLKRDLAAALERAKSAGEDAFKLRVDLAAAQSELASVKAHAEAMAQLIRMFTWMDKHGVQLPAGLYAQVSEYEAAVLAYRRDFPRTP